ncbi:hypothetical protein HDV05_008163, partial [Chytridiales sp. JEL 0842]
FVIKRLRLLDSESVAESFIFKFLTLALKMKSTELVYYLAFRSSNLTGFFVSLIMLVASEAAEVWWAKWYFERALKSATYPEETIETGNNVVGKAVEAPQTLQIQVSSTVDPSPPRPPHSRQPSNAAVLTSAPHPLIPPALPAIPPLHASLQLRAQMSKVTSFSRCCGFLNAFVRILTLGSDNVVQSLVGRWGSLGRVILGSSGTIQSEDALIR